MPYGPIMITVNNFCFCQHLREWCHACCVEHRTTNNMQIEDTLTEEHSEGIAVRTRPRSLLVLVAIRRSERARSTVGAKWADTDALSRVGGFPSRTS